MEYDGTLLGNKEIGEQFNTIGGLVLDECERLRILSLTHEKSALNMAEVLSCSERYRRGDRILMGYVRASCDPVFYEKKGRIFLLQMARILNGFSGIGSVFCTKYIFISINL